MYAKSSFMNLIWEGSRRVHLFCIFQLLDGINKGNNLRKTHQSKTKEKDWGGGWHLFAYKKEYLQNGSAEGLSGYADTFQCVPCEALL